MECAICLEPSFNTTTLPCEHIFCTRCIRKWAKSSLEDAQFPCPTCRATVKINELGLAKRSSRRCASCELGDFREISESTTDQRVYNCDVCGQGIDKQATWLRCSMCDYDACRECLIRLGAGGIAAAQREHAAHRRNSGLRVVKALPMSLLRGVDTY